MIERKEDMVLRSVIAEVAMPEALTAIALGSDVGRPKINYLD
jgi:hypothetical protein